MRPGRENLWIEYDQASESDPTDEWFLPELRSAMRRRRPAEDLGLRRLLEFPEAIAPLSRRVRRVGSETRRETYGPDLPDAA